MRRVCVRWLVLLWSAVAIAGCASDPVEPKPAGDGVLFIGNSLTYFNSLPDIVKAFADSTGEPLHVDMVAFGNYALVDHWNEGTSRQEIGKGGWRYVILQQGPSAVSYNRDSLRLLTKLFNTRIAAVGARPALFSVWPAQENQADFPASMESYRLAAEDVDGLLLPVAAAWLAAWDLDSTLPLYSDGLHPTPEGSYLAALVIYARIFDRTPSGLPASMTLTGGVPFAITSATAAVLQDAAASVLSSPASEASAGIYFHRGMASHTGATDGAASRALRPPASAPTPRR